MVAIKNFVFSVVTGLLSLAIFSGVVILMYLIFMFGVSLSPIVWQGLICLLMLLALCYLIGDAVRGRMRAHKLQKLRKEGN